MRATYTGKACYKCGNTERYQSDWKCVYCVTHPSPEQKARNRQAVKRYLASAKGKDMLDRWKESDTGKQSARDRQARYKAKSDGKKRRYNHVVRKYGLTPGQYEALLQSQCGKCALCQQDMGLDVCVEHDHTTGVVRGLTHRRCNSIMGLAGDNAELLMMAVRYLNGNTRGGIRIRGSSVSLGTATP
jgi:hypothetical protein